MKRDRRRRGLWRNRPRPTPKWLMSSEEIDRTAKERCLLVLSVLSGEKPVTDAIREAGISRGTYYKLETQALNAMLRALGPLAGAEGTETSPVRQIALLEAKVKEAERSQRRTQRLLLMTRRVLGGERKMPSTRRGRGPSPPSKRSAPATKRSTSTPQTTGVAEP
jgi:hypothetical protein